MSFARLFERTLFSWCLHQAQARPHHKATHCLSFREKKEGKGQSLVPYNAMPSINLNISHQTAFVAVVNMYFY